MITQKSINEIFETAKVEEVVEDFVNLRRRGVNMIGLCPFHDEKTPSFTVSPAKNIYKCFGCGKGGNPVQFVMDHENFSFPEALKYIARKYKIELEETVKTEEEQEAKLLTDALYIVNDFARDYFQDQLLESDEGKSVGLSYFKDRGYREATIKKFDLGYATRERDDLTRKAVAKKFNIDHLRNLGLTTKNDIDFFRSRVMFAIHNLSGKVIAFAGRTLSSDKKIPKYINSPESDIYNKRKVLYGLYHARQPIRKEDECIMVEGYTDVITLHQGGIENVVASSGTSLTTEQIRLVKRYTPNIKIIYDGDAAGVKAALRGLDLVLEQDMNVRLVLLPDGEDPDSYIKKVGSDSFKKYLSEHAEDFVFFKTNLLLEEAGDDPIKKSEVLKDIVRSIAKIPDLIKRSLYIQRCSNMLGIQEDILVSETNKVIRSDLKKQRQDSDRQRFRQEAERDFIPEKKQAPGTQDVLVLNDEYQEKDIIRILITMGDKLYDEKKEVSVANYLLTNLEPVIDTFDNDLYKDILLDVSAILADGRTPNHDHYINHPNEKIRLLAVDFLSSPYSYASWEDRGVMLQTQMAPDKNFVKDSYMAILRFKLKKVKVMIAHVQKEIQAFEKTQHDSEEYLLQIKILQKVLEERNSIAQELNTIIIT